MTTNDSSPEKRRPAPEAFAAPGSNRTAVTATRNQQQPVRGTNLGPVDSARKTTGRNG